MSTPTFYIQIEQQFWSLLRELKKTGCTVCMSAQTANSLRNQRGGCVANRPQLVQELATGDLTLSLLSP